MTPRTAGLSVLSAALVIAGLAAPVQAAPEFFGVPNSDRVLQGSLTLPDGKTVHFGSREGTFVSVRDSARHYWYAFQGVFESGIEQTTVRFFAVEPTSEDDAHLQIQTEPTDVWIGHPHRFSTSAGNFTFAYDALTQGHFPKTPFDPRRATPQELEKTFGSTGGGICCVTCGSSTVCASSVTSDCGSCDSGHWVY